MQVRSARRRLRELEPTPDNGPAIRRARARLAEGVRRFERTGGTSLTDLTGTVGGSSGLTREEGEDVVLEPIRAGGAR